MSLRNQLMQRRGDVSVGDVDLFIEWAPPNICDSDMVAMFEEYKRSRAAHNAMLAYRSSVGTPWGLRPAHYRLTAPYQAPRAVSSRESSREDRTEDRALAYPSLHARREEMLKALRG